MAVPKGYVGFCCSRSGLAKNQGVAVLNSPGVIDEDFRGEVGVILVNHSDELLTVWHGDRIAQLVIAPRPAIFIEEVAELPLTERGSGGFGSTGK